MARTGGNRHSACPVAPAVGTLSCLVCGRLAQLPLLGAIAWTTSTSPFVLAVSCSVLLGSTADSCACASLRGLRGCFCEPLCPAVTVRYCGLLRVTYKDMWMLGEMTSGTLLYSLHTLAWFDSGCTLKGQSTVSWCSHCLGDGVTEMFPYSALCLVRWCIHAHASVW